jgi:hypothetical protein
MHQHLTARELGVPVAGLKVVLIAVVIAHHFIMCL